MSTLQLPSGVSFVSPATHVHRYACPPIDATAAETVHFAPFWHGLLWHSFTSRSQLPDSVVLALLYVPVHIASYCAM